MDQRAHVRFCYNLGLKARETHDLMVNVHGERAMDRSSIFRWYSRFRKGRENLEDNPRKGGTRTTRTEENIKRVAEILKENPAASKRLIARLTGINEFSVYQIITDDLKHKKVKKPKKNKTKGGKQSEDNKTETIKEYYENSESLKAYYENSETLKEYYENSAESLVTFEI